MKLNHSITRLPSGIRCDVRRGDEPVVTVYGKQTTNEETLVRDAYRASKATGQTLDSIGGVSLWGVSADAYVFRSRRDASDIEVALQKYGVCCFVSQVTGGHVVMCGEDGIEGLKLSKATVCLEGDVKFTFQK